MVPVGMDEAMRRVNVGMRERMALMAVGHHGERRVARHMEVAVILSKAFSKAKAGEDIITTIIITTDFKPLKANDIIFYYIPLVYPC